MITTGSNAQAVESLATHQVFRLIALPNEVSYAVDYDGDKHHDN